MRQFLGLVLCTLCAAAASADEAWWSLKPLAQPGIPTSKAEAESKNPIDAFIDAELEKNGLKRSRVADARTLIRRLYFDLIGLPPTFEEVAEFEQSSRDNPHSAIGTLADRLLSSPHFGERWARHWLDVVHYGETHGYDKDQPRPNAWPYRDYVIRAFNEDKPYARFVQEQVAGDALFPHTRDGIEALGFIAAGPWDLIGHAELPEEKTDGKIARHLDRDDMVANTINTFCSLTVHCAQCHDHKFDPIPAADYYGLQAVFAALDRADRRYHADPQLDRRRSELENRERQLGARQRAIEARLETAGGSELADLDKRIGELEKRSQQGVRPEYGYHSAIETGAEVRKHVQVDLGRSQPIARVVLAPCWDDFHGIGAGFGFPVRFRIEASEEPAFQGVPQLIAAHDLVDQPNPGTAPQSFAAGVTARFVRVTATKLAPRRDDFIFALAELQVFDATGKNLAAGSPVSSLDSIESPPRWRRTNLTDGIYPAASGAAATGLDELRARREALIERVAPDLARSVGEVRSARDALNGEIKALPPPQLVYAGAVHYGTGNFRGTGGNHGRPRPIHLLTRGDVKRPGREVAPAALTAITTLPPQFDFAGDAPEHERRACLARWLTNPAHPLTWRSIVNRVWQFHFGRGLVDTPNDFGRMGATPSHPELLDWLAVWFRDEANGSLKRLHRLIVTSATYQQQSMAEEPASSIRDPRSIDSENRLLWRMNRRKLEAEPLRDTILAVAGRLDRSMGGPSFQDFVITHPEHSPHYEYHLADLDHPALHRRAVYRFIVRSQQHPWMAAMDCADPSMLVEKRIQTITPLQALSQLNNQLILVMAKHFAARVQREAGPDPGSQTSHAFRLAVQRRPTADELATLSAFAQKHGLPNTCRVIFNLNEFVFID